MSEPKRIQVIRSYEDVTDYTYKRQKNTENISQAQVLISQKDYYALGWKRLNKIQALSLNENWPITLGNAVSSFSSGLLGGLIARRMATNIALNVTTSTLPSVGASFFVVTLSHLTAYYAGVLRPLYSDDPLLCPTCLEIRSFAIGSLVPLTMGTSISVLANLSACLLNKSIRLPEFHPRAYPEWKQFFQRHAFKGMATRYFFAYPLFNGFLASMILYGQTYYWNHHLRQRLDVLDDSSISRKKLK